jgi:3-methyl-2-oxobutanoate hydroxymethyltransferase
VGDSLANVVLGHEDTLHVSVEDMCHHVRAVAAAKPDVHVVADMPWLSYHLSVADSVRNAALLIRSGADSVKLEGGRVRRDVVRAILDAEIPVMAHLGLTPQSVMAFGGIQGSGEDPRGRPTAPARRQDPPRRGSLCDRDRGRAQRGGHADHRSARHSHHWHRSGPRHRRSGPRLSRSAGHENGPPAKFVRQYADLNSVITEAIAHFASDVRSGEFPGPDEVYPNPDELVR